MEEDGDDISMVSSGEELRVTGAKGPFANKINGVYICGGYDNHMWNGRAIYHRCNDSLEKEEVETIILYDEEDRWSVLQTVLENDEQLLLAYCAQAELADPSEASQWFIRQ